MKSERLTDSQIRLRGWEALVETLGPTGALRFSMQTQAGHGEFVELRHQLLGNLGVDELVERMRATPRPSRRRRK